MRRSYNNVITYYKAKTLLKSDRTYNASGVINEALTMQHPVLNNI